MVEVITRPTLSWQAPITDNILRSSKVSQCQLSNFCLLTGYVQGDWDVRSVESPIDVCGGSRSECGVICVQVIET
jgi:hypothetical protein